MFNRKKAITKQVENTPFNDDVVIEGNNFTIIRPPDLEKEYREFVLIESFLKHNSPKPYTQTINI